MEEEHAVNNLQESYLDGQQQAHSGSVRLLDATTVDFVAITDRMRDQVKVLAEAHHTSENLVK